MITRPIIICVALTITALIVTKLLFIGSVILLFDARARYLDYKKFRYQSWNMKMARRFQTSWCSRGVAEYIWPEAKVYYRSIGYRPYHIFPDGSPLIFFKVNFWKSVVGLSTRRTT